MTLARGRRLLEPTRFGSTEATPRHASRRSPRSRFGWRLDHHADQRLGAGGAHEHATRDRRAPRSAVVDRAPEPDAGSIACVSASRLCARMLTSRCGSLRIAWRSLRSAPPSASSVSSALAMPSPEGPKPRSMMWPDCSPPSRQPRLRSSSLHVAVADGRGRHLDPGLRHRGVEAVVGHHRDRDAAALEQPRVAGSARAASAISSSPSTICPSRSTASTRSPSPSNAKPTSCPPLRHRLGRAARCAWSRRRR